jgi:pyrroline-5-carboxylate reductase
MPNTPAMVGKGITVAVANNFCQPNHKLIAKALFETSGVFEWAETEDVMDSVTAISGSGPAYVFYLIEVMTKAGISLGLTPDLAEKLARQTVIGSAALAEASYEISASTLRQNVTSPGGTTAAALEILMKEPGFQQLMNKAVSAAALRSKELS